MASIFNQPWPFPLLLNLIFFFIIFILPFHCFSQSDSPQNIETFFPIDSLSPVSPPRNSPSPNPPPPSNSSSSSSDKSTITKAILITAASTIIIAALFFFILQKCLTALRRRRDRRVSVENTLPPFPPAPIVACTTTTTTTATLAREGFTRFGGVKGLILDENGLDVLYWKKLQSQRERSGSYRKEIISGEEEKEVTYYKNKKKSEPVNEIPLLRGRSSTSHSVIHNQIYHDTKPNAINHPPQKVDSFEFDTKPQPPPPPPTPVKQSSPSASPSPPPIPVKQNAPAPPPPPPPSKKGLTPSPPPPPPVKKVGALSSSASKPPPAPPRGSSGGDGSRVPGQVKLKPLHWDKVNPDSDHSMVWDKIDRGSFSFDGDLMEALFGYVAVGKKSPEHGDNKNPKSTSTSQIFILDPRKSQNTAIVLKSLGMTRGELVEALIEGNDFVPDTLDRLARIAPTKEEQSAILDFDGDTAKLADAESFLFYLLKAVPNAFTRLNAFLFRANYYPEIAHHSKCLQTLDSACKELRSRGLFVKLLEAILKAGNRMNAGTARGNAQAFNLTALLKLSDVKSVDGKTTLLNFVVEEVIRSEGKRCVLNRRNHSLTRSSSRNNNGSNTPQILSKEEQEKEFLKLGLPIVGGLSTEFSNVKKAANVDFDTIVAACSALAARAKDARTVISECEDGDGEMFVKKMMVFLDSVEEEVKMAKEEERKVMELVKRTTDYYQAGATTKGKNPLHLFAIVRDFLAMVDKVCLEITRNMQRRKIGSPVSPSSQRNAVKFPVLPPNFMSDRAMSYSGGSDSDIALQEVRRVEFGYELTITTRLEERRFLRGGTGQVLYQSPLQFKDSPNGTFSSFSTTFVFVIVAVRKTTTGCGLSYNFSPTKGLDSAAIVDQSSSSDQSLTIEYHTAKSYKPGGKDVNSVRIDVHGLNSYETCPGGYHKDDSNLVDIDIASGKPIQVWIEYNSSTKKLDVTMHSVQIPKPKTPLLSMRKDLSPYLREFMYTGFTSVGSPTSSHYILAWNFIQTSPVSGIDVSRLPKVPCEDKDRSLSPNILAISLSISAVTLVIVLVLGFMFFLKRKKFLEVMEDWEVQFGPHRFTYKDLFIATKGFKNSELLGKGGFGKVFKGILPLSSIPIAVKKISHDSKQGMREFLAEIATVGRLRHPDLVRLLGYCRRKGELYLVYDFMPKGSLDKFLYKQPNQILDWSQRFKIIKDVASGLCYLHQQWVQVIIHRDIKPGNILLDDNLKAKLGDFGLAKLCDLGIDSQISNVASTFGYISPELSRTGKSSTSSDVFAFGVFMLEITCGRRPVEPRESDMILTDWVLDSWDSGDILQVLDERLGHSYFEEQVTLVLKLGLFCSHLVAATRPSMSSVIQFLDGVATLPHNLLYLMMNAREFDTLGKSTESMGASSIVSSVMTESFVSGGR